MSSEPETFSYILEDDDNFLIVASHGFWAHLSKDEAVHIVHNYPRMVMNDITFLLLPQFTLKKSFFSSLSLPLKKSFFSFLSFIPITGNCGEIGQQSDEQGIDHREIMETDDG